MSDNFDLKSDKKNMIRQTLKIETTLYLALLKAETNLGWGRVGKGLNLSKIRSVYVMLAKKLIF